MSTLVPASVDRIELQRRLSGLSLTAISQRTGIPYGKVWRFFRSTGSMSRDELARLDAVLEGEAANE